MSSENQMKAYTHRHGVDVVKQNEPRFIEIQNLKKYFSLKGNKKLHAVDDVSFSIERGETVGLVGESGCGKSTVGTVLMRLQPATSGKLFFEGKDLFNLHHREEDLVFRKKMQIIFQDPYSSLNPQKRILDILSEAYQIQKICEKKDINNAIEILSNKVGISKDMWMQYPHELDGGKRQIVGIARALSVNPDFIVCDEPVSALDVSVQAKILNLLMDLQKDLNLSYLFISHDLSVVKHISNRIIVMYLGKIMESADKNLLFSNTVHPYSLALLSAIPQVKTRRKANRILLKGDVDSPIDPKKQCRFAKRCWMSQDICFHEEPVLREIEVNHLVACHFAEESRKQATQLY